MKHLIVLFVLGFSVSARGELTYSGQLSEEDQKYYKNDSGAGMNNLERINSTVKEINKIYGELSSLRNEVSALKKKVAKTKTKKQLKWLR